MTERYYTNEKTKKIYSRDDYYLKFYRGLFRKMDFDTWNGNGKTNLDIGGGMGQVSTLLEETGWETYGLDISDYAINYCREKFKAPERFKVGDATEGIPFDRKFDFVTLFGLLGFGPDLVKDRDRLLRNCMESTKPGGVFLATGPNSGRPGILREKLAKVSTKSIYKPMNRSEWIEYLKKMGWSKVTVRTLQRLPKLVKDDGYVFVDFPWGEPLVILCQK